MNLTTAHKRILRLATAAAWIVMAFSCAPEDLNSDLAIRNGIHLEKSDKNTAPGLVFIGNCSATLVSTNTLITAAHCVSPGNQVCVRSGEWSGTCSNKVYVPSNYRTNRGTNFAYDVAVIVFDGTPFKNFFRVGTRAPQVNDPVVMVGYSSYRNNEPGRGSKRWGLNKISEFDRSELNSITTYDGNSSSRVAVDKGDSGGTMLNNRCELIGVTSRNCGDDGNCSIHTNITNETNASWLLEQIRGKGAQICGLQGTNNSYCPLSGTAVVDPNAAKEADGTAGFPCAPSASSSQDQNTPDDGKIKIGLTGLAQNAFKLHVSIPGADLKIAACADITDAQQCTPDLGSKYFAGNKLRTVGSRGIFEIQKSFSAADTTATWTLVGRDATGAVKQIRKFKISQ